MDHVYEVHGDLAGCSAEKKAEKAFNLGKFETAISYYSKKLEQNPNDGAANFFIAEAYRKSNRLKVAESYYAKAGGPGIDRDSVRFYYAQALKVNRKYEEARKTLDQLVSSTENDALRAHAQMELDGLHKLDELAKRSSFYRVKNLELINTPAAEYSPVFLNNELYFTSNRGNERIYEATGTPFTDLYKVASRGAIVDVATVARLPEGINHENINDGTVTFSPDGRIMIFAKGNTGKRKGGNDVDLYMSRFRNGEWSEPTPLNINDPEAWDSTPAFSPDGRTLYFASNRRGRGRNRTGYGGVDLYSAHMDSRGRFTRVRNLGPDINTPGNEMFPYQAEDMKLYFSSDGHPGFGGLDLFVVKRSGGKNVVENLGEPMNSEGDDFGIFLFRADRGFFTSNREGGKGDDDIYTFVNEDPDLRVVNYYLQGITYAADTSGNRVLPYTKVTLLDASGEVMQDYVTGNDGKFLFRVYENEDYTLVGEIDGYLVERQPFTTKGKGVDPATLKDLVTNITLDTVMILDRLKLHQRFVLENIYYEFDEWYITPQAATELDKLAQILRDNPEIRIELSSHTDSVGTVEYNVELSQKRAESAVRYLVQQGIAPDRMIAKGYGELRPIARNTNPDGTDNREGRAKNRRTEFEIIEINTIVKPLDDEDAEDEFDEDKYFRTDGN